MSITLAHAVPLGIALVVIAIVLGVGADILQQVSDNYVMNTAGCNSTDKTACGYNYNASLEGQKGLDKLASWQDTFGLVLAAAIVIGIVITALSFGRF